MEIEELVFIRDKKDLINSTKKIKIKEKSIFVCLTFEAFAEAKSNKLNYTYPYQLRNMHKTNFLHLGKKQAQNFIKNNFKNFIKEDISYISSRFIIFFSQIIFDKTLIFSLVKLYKPNKIIIFDEKIKSIIEKGWNINKSFYYYKIIINNFFPKINLTFYEDEDDKFNKSIAKIFRLIQFDYIFLNLKNSLQIFLFKNLILIDGFREKNILKKKFINSFKSKNYTIITEYKNSIFLRLKYFFFQEKKIYIIKKKKNLKKKIFGLNYFDLKVEIDSMIKFMNNYLSYQFFLIKNLKRKNFFFGIFQEKYDVNIAFKKAKIKTYQLPHGAIMTPELSPMIGDYNFFSNINQKIYHQKSKMFYGKFHIGGVPHIEKNKANNHKNYKNIIIFMKNMGMRRWEFDDYEKIMNILNYVANFSQKNNFKLIIKFHPSGGKHQFPYFKNSKFLKKKNISLILNYDTDKLLRENEIFICLQETSVINQIVSMNKNLIFPLIHLNKNYIDNNIFKKIKQNFLIPKNLNEIGKYINQLKKGSLNFASNKTGFKSKFGTDSINQINNFILQKVSL